MYKVVNRKRKVGVKKTGKTITLTEEDRKTILKMFTKFANASFAIKENGVWTLDSGAVHRRAS